MMKVRAVPMAVSVAAVLAGCSSLTSLTDPSQVAYKNVSKGPVLDVPPDLVTPATGDQYVVPSRRGAGGVAADETTLSTFNRNRTEAAGAPGGAAAGGAGPDTAAAGGFTGTAAGNGTTTGQVLPERAGVHLERAAGQNYLVVEQPVERVWPQLKDFWTRQGFALTTDLPGIGILETDWSERHANIERTGIRGVLARGLGQKYATGERDRYRTRIERADDGTTRIYVLHSAMDEVISSAQRDRTMWQPVAGSPEFEIEFLRRMAETFGTTAEAARRMPVRDGDNSIGPASRATGSSPAAVAAPGATVASGASMATSGISRTEVGPGDAPLGRDAATNSPRNAQAVLATETRGLSEKGSDPKAGVAARAPSRPGSPSHVEEFDAPGDDATMGAPRRLRARVDDEAAKKPVEAGSMGSAGVSGAAVAGAAPAVSGMADAVPARRADARGAEIDPPTPADADRADRVHINESTKLSTLTMDQGFDRSWRDVGLVLERVGFTVEDKDRSRGSYDVRYVDLQRGDPNQGALSRLFSGKRPDLKGRRYRVLVDGDAQDRTQVTVREADGSEPRDAGDVKIANRIARLIYENLRQ